MVLPDVNTLIYAFRSESPFHAQCSAWLQRNVEGEAQFGLSTLTLSAIARVTTNARTFARPSPLQEVFAFCQGLMDQPNCQLVEPGGRHWSIFERLCRETNVTGPMVTDAWFAALAIEHGCEWITLDRDFGRFSGLRWRSPDAA
jgi:toxin-antitoxin system PIN domain toxin